VWAADLLPLWYQVIEELGEWIIHAFDRHGPLPEAKTPVSAVGSEQPSPFMSETETDDTGITFMAKRAGGTSPPRPMTDKGESRSSSDGTLVETPRRVSTPEKVGTARLGKHIISESELMRRRRLLDSHIFE